MTETGQMEQGSPGVPSRPAKRSKTPIWLGGLLLVAVAGLLAWRLATPGSFLPREDVVATVDGVEITRSELDAQVEQLLAAQPQLPEASAEERQELEQNVLDQIITEELLLADARERGITVSDEAVDEQYSLISDQLAGGDGEASFEELLAAEEMTTTDFRQVLHDQLVIEAYLERLAEERNITVSDEEVRQVYDEQIGDQGDTISFEAVQEQIRQQLEQQKLAEIMPGVIDELRAQADIEILL